LRFDIKYEGVDRLDLAFDEIARNSHAFVSEVLMQLANRLLFHIALLAPVRTGAYVRSWRIMSQTPTQVVVGTRERRLFVLLEFAGARSHQILPKNKEALRFLVGGQEIIVSIVNHPGMRARPHLRPAMRRLRDEAKGMVYAIMVRHFPTLLRKEGAKAARANGWNQVPPRQAGRRQSGKQIGRSTKDTSANIGRGTKGSIRAQLTSRFTGRKRIRRAGLHRVGTGERTKSAGKRTVQNI